MMAVVISTLMGMGFKLLTSSVIEPLILIGLRHLAVRTTSTIDDEIVKVVEDAINAPK